MPMLQDFVLETSSNPGVGDFVLNGAAQDRVSFSQAFPGGGRVFYFADDGTQAEWGIGTLTPGSPATLARSTVLGNTLGNTGLLRFMAGVEVYNEVPAAFLPLLGEDGRLTLASLTVTEDIRVPVVGDWGTGQAVGAADADGRYLRNWVGGDDLRIIRMAYRPSAGAPFIDGFDGGPFFFQPQGDYATNTALAGEAQARADADQSMQASKANLVGGNAFGGLQTFNGDAIIAGGTAPSSSTVYSGRLYINRPDSWKSFLDYGYDGGSNFGRWVFQDGNGNIQDILTYNTSSSRLSSSSKGNFAYTSELPMDASRRTEEFNVSATDGARVNFPNGFSNSDNIVIGITCQRSNGRCVVASYENVDSGGFTLGMQREDTNGASQQTSPWTISVKATGNR